MGSALALVCLVAGCQPPGPKALLRGEQLIKQGKAAEAVSYLRTATQLLPEHAQAWNHLGLALHGSGNAVEAVKAYQQALTLDRNLAAARYNLGMLYLEQGRPAEAISELTTYTTLQPNAEAGWRALASALLKGRRLDEAERVYQHLLRNNPNDPELLNGMGVSQLHRRRLREAQNHFAEANRLDPGYAPAILNQAILSQHYMGNKTYALQKYQEYLALTNSVERNFAREMASRLEAEFAGIPTTVAATPQPAATNFVTTNRPPQNTNRITVEAERLMAALTNRTETATNPAARVQVSAPQVKSNSTPAKVAATPSAALRPEPTNTAPAAVVEMPVPEPVPPTEEVKLDEEQIATTVKDIPVPTEASHRTAPKTPTNVVTSPPPLIRPVEREKKNSSSLVQKLNPVRWFKKEEQEKSEKVEQPQPKSPAAEPAPTQVASIQKPVPEPAKPAPVAPVPQYPRYKYLRPVAPKSGNRSAAVTNFTEGVRLHRENRFGSAIENYQKALEQDGSYFEAQYNLGLAALASNELPLALQALEKAATLNPKSPEAQFHLALALRQAGYPVDAAQQLEALLTSDPKNVQAHLTLGNIQAQELQSRAKAREHFTRVLELEPQHPQAPTIRSWLMTE
ncbi:MAG: tetratricopeptide repeat protein [Verrucomicrobiota bacterium]|nr:tetratricopeptide repeat protein [Verrucomicrobiota bacterium]